MAARQSEAAAVKAWTGLGVWNVSLERPEPLGQIERVAARNVRLFRMTTVPFVPVTPPALERPGEIRAPTLVRVRELDTQGNRRASEVLASGIAVAGLEVVPGADHALPMGWAGTFNERVIRLLDSLR